MKNRRDLNQALNVSLHRRFEANPTFFPGLVGVPVTTLVEMRDPLAPMLDRKLSCCSSQSNGPGQRKERKRRNRL
jgi:hypothetical protein